MRRWAKRKKETPLPGELVLTIHAEYSAEDGRLLRLVFRRPGITAVHRAERIGEEHWAITKNGLPLPPQRMNGLLRELARTLTKVRRPENRPDVEEWSLVPLCQKTGEFSSVEGEEEGKGA